jgi:sugar (pentulose or hexulose) kinase
MTAENSSAQPAGGKCVCLAVDLGANSGRVLAGIYDGRTLDVRELTRFPNDPVKHENGWHWNIEALFGQIKSGIGRGAREFGPTLVSVGVDTWGVDYGLADASGRLLGAPFQYRDSRTDGMQEEAFRRMPAAEIYRRTGIQFMFFNTIFQLLGESRAPERLLERAGRLLFIPDLINFWLTGRQANERTFASTSQLYDPRARDWDRELIAAMGLPDRIFGPLTEAGTVLGPLLPKIAAETGAAGLQVIVPAEHDTGSAVVGVPAEDAEPVFLSSGTWSVMGREMDHPVISEASRAANFSNEGGVFGTTRFLKNIAGMWLLQECKRMWDASGKVVSYDELVARAARAPAFAALIDPDAVEFQAPPNMLDAIAAACRKTGQTAPTEPGAVTRVILESIALKYRRTKDLLAQVTGKPASTINIVGGGSQNRLLNQFAADATGCRVIAGPVEATSIGNLIMQLYALGKIKSLAEGRALTRRSFATSAYEPKDGAAWDEAYGRFQILFPPV